MLALLRSLGVPIDRPEDARRLLQEQRTRRSAGTSSPSWSTASGVAGLLSATIPMGVEADSVRLALELEDGTTSRRGVGRGGGAARQARRGRPRGVAPRALRPRERGGTASSRGVPPPHARGSGGPGVGARRGRTRLPPGPATVGRLPPPPRPTDRARFGRRHLRGPGSARQLGVLARGRTGRNPAVVSGLPGAAGRPEPVSPRHETRLQRALHRSHGPARICGVSGRPTAAWRGRDRVGPGRLRGGGQAATARARAAGGRRLLRPVPRPASRSRGLRRDASGTGGVRALPGRQRGGVTAPRAGPRCGGVSPVHPVGGLRTTRRGGPPGGPLRRLPRRIPS